ncbi:2'-5' RNA ligase [Bacillus mesophilus]|uniref:RNA 2',3'-cyclic phosphodiesterase n=1 Tax=Bacillus mesophilus TaxID=1808955 RepID=A0A6M0Q8Y3_9BACI|nr:RNA 2',3'-cyclic phosphodiesterase [Bacillus mesophilus]MBM7660479.1 2'-5' RNA ligase [Bacillus mesophilus]NEY71970.1 RNA 2',3'-cyclic phosphodiesterase [Bacillus mesophilus]
MTSTHYFLAVPIPQATKQLYLEWRQLVKEKLPFKSWVHHEDYHITLVFLGDAPFSKIQEVKAEMKRIANKHQAFPLQLKGLGTFGAKESPRIFWSGLDVPSELAELQRDIFDACVGIGFNMDKRPYHPHMTLARRWQSEHDFPYKELSKLFQPKEELLTFEVENIVLYQTHLNRSPKYQPLSIFPLNQNG